MSKYYIDAGTTYSKIIEVEACVFDSRLGIPIQQQKGKNYYIIPSKSLKTINMQFEKSCGHMQGGMAILPCSSRLTSQVSPVENEIVALVNGCKSVITEEATILDLGSRDAKWVRFREGKFSDMDWNTSCASSTGATVEMLLKFYDVSADEISFNSQKFPVTCGIFGLEKIMDDISKGSDAQDAIAKFIHGIAYNAWSFAKKPSKIYLSGGFCDNKCFVQSLENYCEVKTLGRFVLCEGLING